MADSCAQTFGIPQVINVSNGEIIDLTAIWKDRKCIVCFLRHFNCRFCRQQISDLNRIHKYLDDHHSNSEDPISIIAIGVSATRSEALEFLKDRQFRGELYVDALSSDLATRATNDLYDTTAPSYDVMRLFDQKSNVFAADGVTFRSEVDLLARKAIEDGFTDGDITGKPKQLFLRVGGMFVLGAGNHCDFSYRSKYAGDHAPIESVLRAAIGENLKEDSLPTFVYPSTKRWANDLDVAHRSTNSGTTTAGDKDATYLESLRLDQEDRMNSNSNRKLHVKSAAAVVGVVASVGCALSIYYGLSKRKMYTALCVVGGVAIGSRYLKSRKKSSTVAPELQIDVELLKLSDIDKIAARMGDIKCDCSFVEAQDVSNKSGEIQAVETRLRALSASPQKCPIKSPITQISKSESTTTNSELKALLKTGCYLREFLAKPHPLVGRKGPVCPFVPGSLRMDAMYLSVIDSKSGGTTTFEEVERVARSFVERFHTLEPKSGKKAAYKAVVLIFPDIPAADAPAIIDRVQLKLKPEFVSKGLMIGEFHKNNNACGLRNENFYPLRTPIPSLAIRCIVPTDLVFLSPTKYSPRLRVEFLKSYLKQFEDDQSRSAQKAVKEATALLESAQREI